MEPGELEKAIDSMVAMIAAITNIRLYPPASAIIGNSIEKAYSAMREILSQEASVSFAESEKSLLISGHMLNEKDQKKPQVISLLELLINLSIKNITFNRGLQETEIRVMLELMSQKPEDLESAGGLQAIMADKNIDHILIDKKVYVAMDKDQQLVSKSQTVDTDIVKYITGNALDSEIDLRKAGEMAKDPEWISTVLQEGLKALKASKKDNNHAGQPVSIRSIISNISNFSDISEKTQITRNMAKSIASMDNEDLNDMFIHNLDDIVNEGIFDHILDEMDDEKFKSMTEQLEGLSKKGPGKGDLPGTADIESINLTFEKLMESSKGKRLGGKEKKITGPDEPDKQKQADLLKAGLSSILKGKAEAFYNKDLIHAIPGMIDQLFSHNKQRTAETIIDKLGDGLLIENQEARTNTAEALSLIGQKLLSEPHPEILHLLSWKYIKWIQFESKDIPARKNVIDQLQSLARNQIENYAFEESNHILEPVHQIFSGKIKKTEAIIKDCGKLLERTGTDDILEILLKEYQTDNKSIRKQIVISLRTLVVTSANFILDILQNSKDMSKRQMVLKLYAEIGKPAHPALIKRIKQKNQWDYTRNLLSLLGKIGSETDVAILRPYLSHKDFRVQRETLNSLNNIGGKYREKILLNMLPTADDRIKINAIAMLGILKSRDAVEPLLELLGSEHTTSSRIKNLLQEKICIAFGRIGSPATAPALKKIISDKTGDTKVKKTAESALVLISKKQSGPGKIQKPEKAKTATPEKSPDDSSVYLEQVDQLISQDQKEVAVKQLYDLIVKCARAKDFKNAEIFREKLFEADPMALTEIIKAGEIIDEEKSEGIDQDHLDLWPELYDNLTADEANALYYAMTEKIHDANQTIVKQGELNQRLYFINQGEIKVVYKAGDRETLLTKLSVGDISGSDTFFSITVCTTSLITLSRVKLTYLDKKILTKWQETFPALESKLSDYCLRMEKNSDILEKKGMDRRAQKRFDLSGKILVQLLSASGTLAGKPFAGSLSDISVGGLSFYIKASTKKTAAVLLGRNIRAKFLLPSGESKQKFDLTGTVIGANYHLNNDYSIHIKFEELIDDHIVEDMAL